MQWTSDGLTQLQRIARHGHGAVAEKANKCVKNKKNARRGGQASKTSTSIRYHTAGRTEEPPGTRHVAVTIAVNIARPNCAVREGSANRKRDATILQGVTMSSDVPQRKQRASGQMAASGAVDRPGLICGRAAPECCNTYHAPHASP
eukprot:352032-Chlamydomonas_euryale.AAC.2